LGKHSYFGQGGTKKDTYRWIINRNKQTSQANDIRVPNFQSRRSSSSFGRRKRKAGLPADFLDDPVSGKRRHDVTIHVQKPDGNLPYL
jgi:hypothetical protein